jgi:hypothetical protein
MRCECVRPLPLTSTHNSQHACVTPDALSAENAVSNSEHAFSPPPLTAYTEGVCQPQDTALYLS